MKIVGLLLRTLRLMPTVAREKPELAISHGSRSQMLTAWLMRIPFILITDYEYVQWLPFVRPSRLIMPEVIPSSSVSINPENIVKYSGIKEDVYVPAFHPNPATPEILGLKIEELIITIRPPATEAHYHNPKSERLFEVVINFLIRIPESRLVILPRNKHQGALLKIPIRSCMRMGK